MHTRSILSFILTGALLACASSTRTAHIGTGSIVLSVPGKIKSLRPEQRTPVTMPAEHYVALKALYEVRSEQIS